MLELAGEEGIPARVGPLPADELRAADEAFLTSTAGGVIPVSSVDGRELGVGPLTRRIRARYWALHEDPRFATPVGYRSAALRKPNP